MDAESVAGPLIALGVAVAALAGLGLVAPALLGRRSGPGSRRRARAGERRSTAPARPPLAHPFLHDDLRAFLDQPPGTGGSAPRGHPGRSAAVVALAPLPSTDNQRAPGTSLREVRDCSSVRLLLALVAAALLLVATSATVALATRAAPGEPAPRAAPTPAPAPDPPLPVPPAEPTPGETGAGLLAHRSVPLGSAGLLLRLSFGGLVLERHAVGVTATYPSVGVTASGSGSGGHALAHVVLPTFTCLTSEAPADPLAAGCVPGPVEYADLPTPALRVGGDGDQFQLDGRFPTYTRPNGSTPTYTGRVYGLALRAATHDRQPAGEASVDAALSLGTDTIGTVGEPGVNVARFAGPRPGG